MKIRIDDHSVEVEQSSTILEAAVSAGIQIPTLCHHPSLEPFGSCRLCTVEIETNGRKRFVTACNYPVEDGLVVRTASPAVQSIRRMIIELFLARCPGEGRIRDLANDYGIFSPRFRPDDEKCILCGLCCRVCAELVGVSAINFQNRGIQRSVDAPYQEISEDCIACGACSLVCPTSAISDQKNIFPITPDECREVENRLLSGERDEDLGVYSELFAASTDINGQDGGVVTTLLSRAIEEGIIDACVVVQKRETYGGKAALVDDIEEVLEAKGTKYVRVSAIPSLLDALEKGKRRIAVVGTPCQIRVIRKMQESGYFSDRFPDAEITLIGLFCFESFDYKNLRAHARELLGIDIEDADRIQIAKGKFTVTLGEKEYSCGVREIGRDIREGCRYCGDLVSRLADISVGSVGSPAGFSTVLIRSKRGERLMERMPLKRIGANMDDIVKLARIKRKNADKNISEIKGGLE